MRLVVKKLEIVDLGQLQSLVIEHIDGIEPGLTVLDSRLLLGHANVDIVAADAQGGLVLVTAGFTADEDMLLKAVEAYSWCLEYPEAIRRLYPSVDVSAARPPRLMFVVDRLPDAFHRKIKQLGFSEVDCVEFRHLDLGGTQAAYFDTIARLRRGAGVAEFQPAPIARRVSEPARRESERPVEHGDKVVPLGSAPNNARATSVRLQKMLNTTGHGNGAAPVIDLASRVAAAPAPRAETPAPRVEIAAPRAEAVRIERMPRIETPSPRIETPAPEIELPHVEIAAPTIEIAVPEIEAPGAEIAEPDVEVAEAVAPRLEAPAPMRTPVAEAVARVALRGAIPVPAPVVVAAPVPQAAEPRVSFAEVAKELLGTPASGPKPAAPAIKPIAPAPSPVAPAIQPIAPAPKPAPAIKPIAPAPQPNAPAPQPITGTPKPVAPAARPAVAAPKPATVAPAAATKAAAAVAAEATPAAPETSAQKLPQEFEGLKFPNDGVLTRQWMEFLNQMASSK
jgi:hypothetical protein